MGVIKTCPSTAEQSSQAFPDPLSESRNAVHLLRLPIGRSGSFHRNLHWNGFFELHHLDFLKNGILGPLLNLLGNEDSFLDNDVAQIDNIRFNDRGSLLVLDRQHDVFQRDDDVEFEDQNSFPVLYCQYDMFQDTM